MIFVFNDGVIPTQNMSGNPLDLIVNTRAINNDFIVNTSRKLKDIDVRVYQLIKSMVNWLGPTMLIAGDTVQLVFHSPVRGIDSFSESFAKLLSVGPKTFKRAISALKAYGAILSFGHDIHVIAPCTFGLIQRLQPTIIDEYGYREFINEITASTPLSEVLTYFDSNKFKGANLFDCELSLESSFAYYGKDRKEVFDKVDRGLLSGDEWSKELIKTFRGCSDVTASSDNSLPLKGQICPVREIGVGLNGQICPVRRLGLNPSKVIRDRFQTLTSCDIVTYGNFIKEGLDKCENESDGNSPSIKPNKFVHLSTDMNILELVTSPSLEKFYSDTKKTTYMYIYLVLFNKIVIRNTIGISYSKKYYLIAKDYNITLLKVLFNSSTELVETLERLFGEKYINKLKTDKSINHEVFWSKAKAMPRPVYHKSSQPKAKRTSLDTSDLMTVATTKNNNLARRRAKNKKESPESTPAIRKPKSRVIDIHNRCSELASSGIVNRICTSKSGSIRQLKKILPMFESDFRLTKEQAEEFILWSMDNNKLVQKYAKWLTKWSLNGLFKAMQQNNKKILQVFLTARPELFNNSKTISKYWDRHSPVPKRKLGVEDNGLDALNPDEDYSDYVGDDELGEEFTKLK